MLDGNFAEQTFLFPEQRAYPPQPQETSGLTLGSEAIYRYALKSSEYPTIIIADDISDGLGNIIEKGYYEIALSDEKDFFIIMQTSVPVAIIPVFKIIEDNSVFRPDKKLQKIKKKQEKEREKINKKRAKVNMPLDEEKIHMEASINYIKDGNYYLIEYEKGPIRAWGAMKSN